jgi:serine/threonine-protein phosphatase 4 catalytic subunit
MGTCVLNVGRCGNVAAILELDEHLNKSFKVGGCMHVARVSVGWLAGAVLSQSGCLLCSQVFEAAPQDMRGVPAKKVMPNYFL